MAKTLTILSFGEAWGTFFINYSYPSVQYDDLFVDHEPDDQKICVRSNLTLPLSSVIWGWYGKSSLSAILWDRKYLLFPGPATIHLNCFICKSPLYHVCIMYYLIFMSFYFLRLFAISQVSSNKCKKDMVVRKIFPTQKSVSIAKTSRKKKKNKFSVVLQRRGMWR